MTSWAAPFSDGWYPKLSPDGRYLLCGAKSVRIVDIATKAVTHLGGPPQLIAAGWLNDTQAVISGDLSGSDKQWQTLRADAPAFGPLTALTVLGPSQSFLGAGGNVWAGGNTRVITVGDATGHARQIADGYAATVDTTGTVAYSIDVHTSARLVVWRNGQVMRTIVPAYSANRFLIGAGGYVGYGYYGPSWLNTPANENVEVTVTPDSKESPPLPFRHQGAVWLATTSDSGVYLRPLGVRDRAIKIPIPSIECSVISTGPAFLVACSNDKGALTLLSVPADTPLLPVDTTPPMPAPVTATSVPAFPRKLWIAPYFSYGRYGDTPKAEFVQYGNAATLVGDPRDPAVIRDEIARVGKLGIAMVSTVNTTHGNVVAWLVSGASLADLQAEVAKAKLWPKKPIIAYLDMGAGWPTAKPGWVTGQVWPAIQAYRGPSEALGAFQARIEGELKAVDSYGGYCVLTPRWDDFNGSSTVARTIECMPLYVQWTRTYRVAGVMAFSDRRGQGIAAVPELRQWAESFFQGNPERPNRFDYWASGDMEAALKNKLGQTVEMLALSADEKQYLLGLL